MWPEVLGRGPCQPAFGGDKRDRTADPLLAKQVLSQLSYTPASKALRLLRKLPGSLLRLLRPFSFSPKTVALRASAFRGPRNGLSKLRCDPQN